MGGPRQEEVPWDLFDRCLLPVLFCHAAAVILATLLNLLYISSVSIFTVFLWLLVIVLGGVFFYHNLKVTAAGKGVLITECDSPLGYAAARQLDEMGFTVFAGFKDSGKAQKLKGESSGRLHILELDVTSEEQIVAAAKYIGLNLPLGATGLWGVINNASWAPFGEVEWVPFKVYKQATDVNLLSVIRITQIFLPLLRKTKGRFINVVSIQGRVASPFKSPYCIVKAGVEAFSECLSLEMRKWGVDVVLVEPGNYTSWSGCTDEELYGQARQMWNEMSEEAKADYGEDYFEQRVLSLRHAIKNQAQLVSSAPEIVGGKSHPCYRKCLPGLTSTCVYNFTISEHGTMALQCGDCPNNLTHCGNVGCIQAGGLIRVSSVVNQRIPGPGIQVCLGDLVVVNVHNGFMSKVVTVHWHGLHQTQTPHMDGVPFLTQCPIQPHTDFTYKFVADTPGTHMWHSHIGFEESDGLFGPLVVRRPLASDPSSPHYDYDLAEHYIIVWHWYSQPSSHHLTTALHMNGSVYGAGLIINGKGGLENFGAGWNETYSKMPRETFTISKGKRYRFRLAFNSAVYCPVQMSIDQHKLTVIASESASFQPVEVSSLMMNGGERYDVVVKGDQIPGNYWIRFRALGDCYKDHIKVHQEAVLHYQETEEGLPVAGTTYEDGRVTGKVLNPMQVSVTNYTEDSIILVSDLNNTDFDQEVDVSGEPDHVEYLYFDFNSFDNLVAPGPYPQINNKLFGYPPFPLLTQREHVTPDLFCRSNTTDSPHCSDKYCKCPYVIDLPLDSLVEIVLIDISIIRDQDHPFHLHGYSFHVVAMGTVGENITLDYIRDLNEKGKIPKKLNNAPIKDTVSVPTRGYAILRFVTSNPGYWFFHCHISNHVEMGMALVMKVGDHEDMLEEPEDFPTCGSWQRKAESGDEKYYWSSASLVKASYVMLLSLFL